MSIQMRVSENSHTHIVVRFCSDVDDGGWAVIEFLSRLMDGVCARAREDAKSVGTKGILKSNEVLSVTIDARGNGKVNMAVVCPSLGCAYSVLNLISTFVKAKGLQDYYESVGADMTTMFDAEKDEYGDDELVVAMLSWEICEGLPDVLDKLKSEDIMAVLKGVPFLEVV